MWGYALIPATDLGSGGQRLRKRDAFLLPATDTANRRIADRCVLGMSQPKCRRQNVRFLPSELAPRFSEALAGGTRGSGKVEGLVHRECGEVDIVFRTVLDVAAVVVVYLLGREGVVVDVPLDGVVVCSAICECFEEGGAS